MGYIFGFDPAQRKDYSGLVFIEQSIRAGERRYLMHALERLPHGMPYPAQVQHVRQRIAQSPGAGGALAIDQTGVGLAITDMFFEANLPVTIYPVLITSGHQVQKDPTDRAYRVPKKELVGTMMVLVESGRLRMAPGLKYEAILKAEMQNFTAKITTAGNQVFESWREGDHDDLVLSVALALWVGENTTAGWDGTVGLGPKGPTSRAPKGVFLDQPEEDRDDRDSPREGGLRFPSW